MLALHVASARRQGRLLERLFSCEIDVQTGNGRLNYISGYVSKDHDAIDVGLGEFKRSETHGPWGAAYRCLSRSTPGLPEAAIRLAGLQEWQKSYSHELLYPPLPVFIDLHRDDQDLNFSCKMYFYYLQEQSTRVDDSQPLALSFLAWHRDRRYDRANNTFIYRTSSRKCLVIACRYHFEMTDNFFGQFALTQLPHAVTARLLPSGPHLTLMQHFVGVWQYLCTWCWVSEDLIRTDHCTIRVDSLPILAASDGAIRCLRLPDSRDGDRVFLNDASAISYLVDLCVRDLEYRGHRDDRTQNFRLHVISRIHFHRMIQSCSPGEVEAIKAAWEEVNRPRYQQRQWGPEQQQALQRVDALLSVDDESVKRQQNDGDGRYVFLNGAPGSGKSAVLTEMALRACKKGIRVVIVCPTGQLVYSFKSSLPDVEGIELISVDTMAGLLCYQRPRDGKVRWCAPSALRKIDLILVDEASQYNDRDFLRFYPTIRQQPHAPVVVVVADFQQLQSVGPSDNSWRRWCHGLPNICQLGTIYRTCDPTHLQFLTKIRHSVPDRSTLMSYFGARYWDAAESSPSPMSLRAAVIRGLQMSESSGLPFNWLTATNKGAALICHHALHYLGVDDDTLGTGFDCDPDSGSHLPIVAVPGVLLRLTRNIDKQRGFVNGAVGKVEYSLHSNEIFVVRLLGSGNLILVHPILDGNRIFLPCCYGYATTIRRAQGASYDLGAIWFDQHEPAGLGYGYVAVSRFRTRDGVHLFGLLRSTDFQPVGTVNVLRRSHESDEELVYHGDLYDVDDDEGSEDDHMHDFHGAVEFSDCDSQHSADSHDPLCDGHETGRFEYCVLVHLLGFSRTAAATRLTRFARFLPICFVSDVTSTAPTRKRSFAFSGSTCV